MVKKNSCGDLFVSLTGAIYSNTVFSRFFEQNDPLVLGWAENVLAKLTADGILPTFLQKKDNEDFKAYWGTITHLFALVVIYARKYKEIDSNKILFETFIQNKGLLTDLVDSQEQMEYFFNNYLEEYSKRGRLDIVSKEGLILGELLRLIRYNSLDEFIFALLQPQNTGWVMGASSPSWNRTNTITNVTKAYEFTSDVVDLSKYPLLQSSGVSIIADRDGENNLINVMTFSGNQSTGIQGDNAPEKYILIDPNISYEISLKIKASSLQNLNLQFGVQGYDADHKPLYMLVLKNLQYETAPNNYFHTDSFLNILNSGVYYEIKGIILAYNKRYLDAPSLNFQSGRALSFDPLMKFISPIFIQQRSSNADPSVYLYDFKVKPLTLPFEQGYLGARDIIASYYRNNAFQKEAAINLFLGTYLLSYKNIFGSKQIEPLTQAYITFKVFSDRNKYIQNATVTINRESYITNVNGEVTIPLYPGEYSYNVTANNFDSVINNVLTVDSNSRVEYVQLLGTTYQRTVAFLVKSNGYPIQYARVTFADQTQVTGVNGLVFFEVFPGIYSYKVEKEDYYTISRNVSIEDSTTIEVDLQAVPYYNVSFRVRDGINPVPGAAVVVTGDFNDDGNVSEQTGSTNSQGIASGFSMKAGTYHYRISRADFITVENNFTIISDAMIEVPISPVPEYKVTFVVKNNALPVEGATVIFNGETQLTDALGKAEFSEPNGEYNYSITKTEFITQNGSLVVSGADVTKNIDFIQIGYLLRFITVDSDNNVLPGVKINIGLETITTNTSGEAQFVRISGSYNWTATLNRYYQETGVAIVNGENKTVTVKMVLITYNAVFTIRIGGKVLPNQPVMCNGKTLNTDYQGIAKFNLPIGSYGWSVEKENYDSQAGTVLIVDRDVAINVDLAATKGTMVLTIRDSESKQLLDNAAVTVNGETKYTAITGQVSFNLVVGSYNFIAAKEGYNTNEGTFKVVEGTSQKEILLVKAAEKTYSLIFTAKDGSNLLANVDISLDNGMTGVTNAQGQSIFTVVSGIYNYTATYNDFFDPLQGSVTVSGTSVLVSLNFIRKTTDVTFKTIDSISSDPVSGVSIEFNNQTKTTNILGDVMFENIPMSSNSLRYIASKNPPYQDYIGNVVVNKVNPTVEIKMGQNTYDIVFTVKTNTGIPVQDAYIACNGKSGNTNSSGQLTLSGFINGSYSYTITNNAYQPVTDTIEVSNANAYANAVMIPIYNTVTIHVQFNSETPVVGVGVEIDGDISVMPTDIHGNVTFLSEDGNHTYVVGNESVYFPITGSFTVSGVAQTITVTLEDVFTLEITVPSAGSTFILPITNDSLTGLEQLKVDWGDGTSITTGQKQHTYTAVQDEIKVKISLGGSSTPLKWGFKDAYTNADTGEGLAIKTSASLIRRILQWFQAISAIEILSGGFAYCTNLTSVGFVKGSQISGTPAFMFLECTALTETPNGFFNWSSNNGDFNSTFSITGLSGIITPAFFEGVNTIVDFSHAFEGTLITGFTAILPDGDYSASYAFFGCVNLTICNAFDAAVKINSLVGTFNDCTSLNSWPRISGITTVLDINELFYNCSSLPYNDIDNYLPRGAQNCKRLFCNCTNISAFATGLFGSLVTNVDQAFQNCKRLTDITNTKIPSDNGTYHVKTMYYTYSGSGVTTIPSEFFKGMRSIETFYGTFKDCKSLVEFSLSAYPGIFEDCSPVSMHECFSGCTYLKASLNTIFGWNGWPTLNTWCVARSCVDYSHCFENCINLTSAPPYVIPDNQVLYIYEWYGASVKGRDGSVVFKLPDIIVSDKTFAGCTKMLHYDDIPSGWK